MTVEIYLLEQLDALARKGTLSAASEELHLTQPTLAAFSSDIAIRHGMNRPARIAEHHLV